MGETRNPQQKRSLEKKEKILAAGFCLFCEKGYYRTTTTDIAKAAGISTGALYSYYADKKDIFIESFEIFFNEQYQALYEMMEACGRQFDLSEFIDMWIDLFLEMYRTSNGAIAQLAYMSASDEEIDRHFCHYEDTNIQRVHALLEANGIPAGNLTEKIFIAYILIDALGEMSVYSYEHVNLELLRAMIKKIVTDTFQ